MISEECNVGWWSWTMHKLVGNKRWWWWMWMLMSIRVVDEDTWCVYDESSQLWYQMMISMWADHQLKRDWMSNSRMKFTNARCKEIASISKIFIIQLIINDIIVLIMMQIVMLQNNTHHDDDDLNSSSQREHINFILIIIVIMIWI